MSGRDTEVVYWDTCVFYALLKAESSHGQGILEGITAEYEAFLGRKIKLITSTIAIAEMAAGKFENPATLDRFKDLRFAKGFEFIAPTIPIMELTSKLKDYYRHNPLGDNGQFWNLQLGDALHLATAIGRGAHHFVTLDAKNKPKYSAIGLLNLASPLAGEHPLNIRRPIPPPPRVAEPEPPSAFDLRGYDSKGHPAT